MIFSVVRWLRSVRINSKQHRVSLASPHQQGGGLHLDTVWIESPFLISNRWSKLTERQPVQHRACVTLISGFNGYRQTTVWPEPGFPMHQLLPVRELCRAESSSKVCTHPPVGWWNTYSFAWLEMVTFRFRFFQPSCGLWCSVAPCTSTHGSAGDSAQYLLHRSWKRQGHNITQFHDLTVLNHLKKY